MAGRKPPSLDVAIAVVRACGADPAAWATALLMVATVLTRRAIRRVVIQGG